MSGDEAGDQGRAPGRYLRAWFLRISDGRPSRDPGAARLDIGATPGGRVLVVVPAGGIELDPATADHVAARIVQAARIARDPGAMFAPDDAGDDFEQLREFDRATRADYPEKRGRKSDGMV